MKMEFLSYNRLMNRVKNLYCSSFSRAIVFTKAFFISESVQQFTAVLVAVQVV